jgi:hypothetical protein
MTKLNLEEQRELDSLERRRYQPLHDERIGKLPIYLAKDIKALVELSLEERWQLNNYSSSYSGNQNPPLCDSNTFFEYLDESLDPNMVSLLLEKLEDMPLHINHEQAWHRALSKWRLKIGK